jgi:aminoglycoside phosphotransferase
MARARRALGAAGLDIHIPLTRASSVTNEVWISDEYVVRVNRQPNQRLRREAALGPLLPAEIGYPGIVAYGGQLGADWLVLRRVPGNVLSRCWPTMSTDERREAVRQLARIMRAKHGFVPPADLPEIDTPQQLGGHGFRAVDPLLSALAQAEVLPHVDPHLIRQTRELVLDTCAVIEPFDIPTLVHGDLHFENVLWDGATVTALLDFEWCRPGPPDLDLDVFSACSYPYLHVAEDYEHLTRPRTTRTSRWMAEDYPSCRVPERVERTRIYPSRTTCASCCCSRRRPRASCPSTTRTTGSSAPRGPQPPQPAGRQHGLRPLRPHRGQARVVAGRVGAPPLAR